jgi:hypothetical protein
MGLKAKGNGKRYIHWIINIRFNVKKMLFVHFGPKLLPKRRFKNYSESVGEKRPEKVLKKKQGERRTQ